MKRCCSSARTSAVVANEITRLDQEIEEIEAASAAPSALRSRSTAGCSASWSKRSEIGVAGGDERVKIRLHLVPAAQASRRATARRKGTLCTLPVPAPSASEVTQRCFEPVIVAAAHRFELGVLFDESCDLGEIAGEIIIGPRAFGGETLPLRQLLQESIDDAVAIEWITAPRRGKIAMFDKAAEGAAQHLARSLAFRPASQDAAYAFGRIGERRLNQRSNAWSARSSASSSATISNSGSIAGLDRPLA